MSPCRIVATMAILAAAITTPAPAQQVMSEPAYCAFFYPNANCQNKGPGNPYTDPNYRRNGGQSSGLWPSETTVGIAPNRIQRSNGSVADGMRTRHRSGATR